jgi:hypothetical protein
MAEMLILAVVALAGYADLSGWWALLGACLLTVVGWARKVVLLRRRPQVPFSTKMTTYLVVSILINLVAATLAHVAGRIVRSWLDQG